MNASGDVGRDALAQYPPRHPTLVGIDSDGCVFDTMEVKQKQHFHPLILRYWNLEPIEAEVRQAAEFINLYSASRGQNRFISLLKLFKMLPRMPAIRDADMAWPPYAALEAYVRSGLPLGTPSLREEVRRSDDPELRRVLEWSEAVNRDIDERMPYIPPFTWARKSIRELADRSDIIVVSQTPEAALAKEWDAAGLADCPRVIAGQELGTKSEHLKLAAQGRYAPERVLMIGDAPGDRKAAEDRGALFYPINPGHEEESWRRFHEEIRDRFLEGRYTAAEQAAQIAVFEALLPDTPPWDKE